jgi:hypothetical protein
MKSGFKFIKLRMETSLKSQASDWLKWRLVRPQASDWLKWRLVSPELINLAYH